MFLICLFVRIPFIFTVLRIFLLVSRHAILVGALFVILWLFHILSIFLRFLRFIFLLFFIFLMFIIIRWCLAIFPLTTWLYFLLLPSILTMFTLPTLLLLLPPLLLPLLRFLLRLLLFIVLRINPQALQILRLPLFPLLLFLPRYVLVKRFSIFFDPEFLVIVDGDLDNSVAADFFLGWWELGNIWVFEELFDGWALSGVELETGTDHV